MPATERLTIHARRTPAGGIAPALAFLAGGEVLGHAVLQHRETDGPPRWYVTDRDAPPFAVEDTVVEGRRTWLLSRLDGGPFARIEVAGERPLDVVVLDGTDHLVRVEEDGTLRHADGGRLGRVERPLDLEAPDGATLELPVGGDPVLRAALLTLPLCVLPHAASLRSAGP
jgi:hypothetical protein